MEQQLTMEYIISHSELTVADFENVDFDVFVSTYELTTENFGEYYLPDLIAMYHREMASEDKISYISIYTKANGQMKEEDIDQIDVLVLEYHEGTDNCYLIIDFGLGEVYKSRNDIISSCGASDKVADLQDDDRIFVLDSLHSSGITEWGTEYIGTNEDTTGSLSWIVGIRLNDGRCFKYHGSGIRNSGSPSEVFELQDSLKKYFG